jgi:TRAP transporter TAXI family solute receptor
LYCVLVVAVLAAAFSTSPADAQKGKVSHSQKSKVHGQKSKVSRWFPEKQDLGALGEQTNANVLTIVSGPADGTYLAVARDLAAVLDDGADFRLTALLGRGGAQNIRDVRSLKGVDLGITQSNLLDMARKSKDFGPLDDKVVYVARLFNEEMHVIVRADAGITAIDQLAGKTVNVGPAGSSTQLTVHDVLGRLNIQVEEVHLDDGQALDKLRSGALDAIVIIGGKPIGMVRRIRADSGLRFASIPYAKPLQATYVPSSLAGEDYPGLAPDGDGVETIAIGAVLIAYNWPRGSEPYRRLEHFVGRFFTSVPDLQKPPHHPKWRETNVAAVLPGWTRFPPADAWLKRNRAALAARPQFDQFLTSRAGASSATGSAAERERMFQEFLKWRRGRSR